MDIKVTQLTVFDAVTLAPHRNSITGLSIWTEYYKFKRKGEEKIAKYLSTGLEEIKTEIKTFKNPKEADWIISLNTEIERDEDRLKFHLAQQTIYERVENGLRELEKKCLEEEENYRRHALKLEKYVRKFNVLNQELQSTKEHLETRLHKLKNLLQTTTNRKDEKITISKQKTEKVKEEYDDLFEKKEIIRPVLISLSDKTRNSYEKKEINRIVGLLQSWKGCLSALEAARAKFPNFTQDMTKALDYADAVEVKKISKSNCKNRTRLINEHNFKNSDEIINKFKECREFMGIRTNYGEQKQEEKVEQEEPVTPNQQVRPEELDSTIVEDFDEYATAIEQHQPQNQPIPMSPDTAVGSLLPNQISSTSDGPIKAPQKPLPQPTPSTPSTSNGIVMTPQRPTPSTSNLTAKASERPLPYPAPSTFNGTTKAAQRPLPHPAPSTSNRTTTAAQRPLPHPAPSTSNGTDAQPQRTLPHTTPSTSNGTDGSTQRPVPRPSTAWGVPVIEPSNESETAEAPPTPQIQKWTNKKAKVHTSYNKRREDEMTIKKGEKVKLREEPTPDGYVYASKINKLKLHEKFGRIPLSKITIL